MRDATMAYHLMDVLAREEATVVVLIGSAHASKFVVPHMLLNHLTVNEAVLMPRGFRELAGKDIDAGSADYIWY